MSCPVAVTETTLEAVAAQINQAHSEAQAYAAKAVERALVAGDLLIEAKSRVKHGEFIPWCKQHCPAISQRTIQDYMRVARELPIEKRSAAYLPSVREALRVVAGEEREPPALEHQPEIIPPLWETQTPEQNAAWCADGDLLGVACVWMDAEGIAIADIANRLGVTVDAVSAMIDPIIPDDISYAIAEVPSGVDQEVMELWNRCVKQANRNLTYLQSINYRDAAQTATCCKNADMANRLSGIAEMHNGRYQRTLKDDDDLVKVMAFRLTTVARRPQIEKLLPAVWMELGMAALVTDCFKSKWLKQFAVAMQVYEHCNKDKHDEYFFNKPFHLAAIGGL